MAWTEEEQARITEELDRAVAFLGSLEEHTLDVITVHSPTPDDAPFLGRNISKLSPIVSNLIESQVVASVAEELDTGGEFDWVRQDPGWPDAGLFLNGELAGGFEVKAWYVLATEMTGRFHAAQSAIADLQAKVIIVPWVMDRVVFGQPRLLGHIVVEAGELAAQRDAYYHRPPQRIVVEPGDDPDRANNLRQTNVIGHKLQAVGEDERRRAELFVSKFDSSPVPHHDDTRELNRFLLNNFPYREESNFGKLHRIYYPPLSAYEAATLETPFLGRTLDEWRTTLRSLGSDDDEVRLAAEVAVEALYVEAD